MTHKNFCFCSHQNTASWYTPPSFHTGGWDARNYAFYGDILVILGDLWLNGAVDVSSATATMASQNYELVEIVEAGGGACDELLMFGPESILESYLEGDAVFEEVGSTFDSALEDAIAPECLSEEHEG